jgi:hypothetical protein
MNLVLDDVEESLRGEPKLRFNFALTLQIRKMGHYLISEVFKVNQ